MKKHILYILALVACANASAQTEKIVYLSESGMTPVTEDVLTIETKNGDNIVMTSRHSDFNEKDEVLGFKTIGAKGKVSIPWNNYMEAEVDNVDIFASVDEVAEYSAHICLQKNEDLFGDYNTKNYGFYISTNPDAEPTSVWASGSGSEVRIGMLNEGECVDVQLLKYNYGNWCETECRSLGYNTTYYVRPYVNITTPNGMSKMFGGTETFTTLRTIGAFLGNETRYTGRGTVILSDDAVDALCSKHADKLGNGDAVCRIVTLNWAEFLDKNPDIKEAAKTLASTKKEECVNGTVYVLSAVPEANEAAFLDYMLNEEVVVDFPQDFCTETTPDGKAQTYASANYSDDRVWVETDNSYGGYYLMNPSARTASARYSFKLSKTFVPGKYNIYLTFAPGIGEEDVQKNKLRICAYNYDAEATRYVEQQLVAEDEHADGKNILVDTTDGCDTVCLTCDLAGVSYLQLNPQGKVAEINGGLLTKTVRIAEIKVTHAEK